jgi:hypothetical protein
MFIPHLFKGLFRTTVALGAIAIAAPQASAGVLHNGWNYSIDSLSDGSGGYGYEIEGLATKESADSIYFALTGGTPITGVQENAAHDGNIGWGDLFLNFSGDTAKQATEQGNLFGIRFADTNDSGVNQVGLYSNVKTKSVTGQNNGYGSLKQYYDWGYDRYNTFGTDLATKEDAYAYLYGNDVANNPTYNNTIVQNSIGQGNFLGGIDFLSNSDLASTGLDFGNFGVGNAHTIGFKFSKSLLADILPDGISPFMAHVFLECANDAVAIASSVTIPGESKDVPEPTTLLGLGLFGLVVAGQRRKSVAKA